MKKLLPGLMLLSSFAFAQTDNNKIIRNQKQREAAAKKQIHQMKTAIKFL